MLNSQETPETTEWEAMEDMADEECMRYFDSSESGMAVSQVLMHFGRQQFTRSHRKVSKVFTGRGSFGRGQQLRAHPGALRCYHHTAT